MNIVFTGKIVAAEPYQQGTSQRGTQWCSQNFVIEELNQQYPSRAVFQVYGPDKLQQFNLQVGEIVTVHISPNARQAQDGRWFNQLNCWKIDRPGAQNTQAYAQPAQQPQAQTYQSSIGQTAQQGMMQQQPQPNGGQQGNIPFPSYR